MKDFADKSQFSFDDSESLNGIEKLNHAVILGEEHPDLTAFLKKPMTFMTGDLYPDDNRRSTRDGDWKRTEIPVINWFTGDGETWGLTVHPEGRAKDGASIVPSENIDGARKDSAVKTMHAIGIDIDSGTSLDHVLEKLQEAGLFASVYTTFNHNKTEFELKHDDVMRKMKLDDTPNRAQVQEYLRLHHGTRFDRDFISEIEIFEARRQTKDGLRIVLKTPPIDKFRVVLPLAEPVELADLAPTLAQWKDVWADKVAGVCRNILDAHFDVASCDVNRLFYTPRHPKGDDTWRSYVIMGRPLTFEEIEPYAKTKYVKERAPTGDPFLADGSEGGEAKRFLMPETGRSLNKWHHEHKHRFLICDAIEASSPDRIRVAGGERPDTLHIECPFEHEHSSSGGTASMVMNPHANEHEVWSVFCHHDACKGRHKLEFIQQMLEDGWFEEDALFDEEFLLIDDEVVEVDTPPLEFEERRKLSDPLFDAKLVEGGWVAGEGDKLRANVRKIEAQMRQSMSEMFSFVILEGGEPRVVLRPSRGCKADFWRDTGFSKAFKNRCVAWNPDGKKVKQIDPAQLFLTDPARKTHVGTQFEPDAARVQRGPYNTWTGIKAEPVAGDWSLLRDHIRNQIIAGNGADDDEDEKLFNWVMTWLADLFQNPGRKLGSSIALIGDQGTGKSKLWDHVRLAIGCHATKITSRKALVGNFNAHLDAKILVVAEEAFWSGDKEAAGTLKDHISSETITIERKGVDQAEKSNYIRFAFVSNEEWVIPTDDNADARRFAVFRVNNNRKVSSDKDKENIQFFKDIDVQMANGGLEAMTHELMNWDPAENGLTWDALRSPPKTAALQEQASYGLSGEKGALMSVIEAGVLSGIAKDGTAFTYDLSEDEPTPVLREHLVVAIRGKGTHGGAAKATANAVRDLLGKDAYKPDSKKNIEFVNPRLAAQGDDGVTSKKGRWVEVPALAGLRAKLAQTYG